jgi:hypothetical protein
MTPQREKRVRWLLAGILGASLFDIVADREDWPFSNYPMYSDSAVDLHFATELVYGVVDDGSDTEIPLLGDAYLAPFDNSRLIMAFKIMATERRERSIPVRALADVLRRYESRRRAHLHDGPPLKTVRLYRVEWELDPWKETSDVPDRRTLILESSERGL